MDRQESPQPARRGFDEAYQQAYQLASRRLKDTADLHALCRRSDATLAEEAGEKIISLDYLGRSCRVILPDVEASVTNGEPLSPRDKLIILHYLNTADGSPLTDRLITFKELPEGAVYYPTYVKRTIKPLLDKFADRPEALMVAAGDIGGIKAETGDFSFRLNPLPRVPLTFTLWLGDEELPPEGNILFDSSITGYLPTEDITVLCEILAWKLVRLG
ncbi:MAG: DUF3786 domain-containing protein [Dehalococcoidia bacterium]|nr:MAG: DUF3786 domain-containing protein [Dehalococcoidia bacterium]